MQLCRLFCSPRFAALVAALVLLMDLPNLAKGETDIDAAFPGSALRTTGSLIEPGCLRADSGEVHGGERRSCHRY